jgi:glycosyltransferase involved in cell wall biosynthesis
MKLIFAIPGDLGLVTGGYRYDRNVMARLSKCGIDVDHCQLPGSFPHPTVNDLAEAVRTINAPLSPGDIVLIDGLAYGVFSQAACRGINGPIIALCHHPLGLEAGLEPERKCALLASEENALAYAAHVIVTSAYTAKTLEQEFHVPKARISVASPGTEPAPRAEGSGGPVSFLAVGSITPRKAFDVLIEALVGLKNFDWRLNIVGGGHHAPETAAAIMRLIEEYGLSSRVECLGELEGTALGHVFNRSDVFVSSSLYEGYGMALAEALARGLPVITTTGGAAAETVPDEAALKIPPGDAGALREALRSLLLDAPLRKRLSEEAWRVGQSLPSWRDTAEAVACVVEDVALATK